MTEQEYELNAEEISRNIWAISTNDGLNLDEDLWDSHRANCDAAVANSFFEGISIGDWQAAALSRIHGAEVTPINTIDFHEDAVRLISQWAIMDEDARDEVSIIDREDGVPFTVYDDFSVSLGHHTDGLYGTGSDSDPTAFAQIINDCAAMLDHQPSDMTGDISHDTM
jgi:hypothetical protein